MLVLMLVLMLTSIKSSIELNKRFFQCCVCISVHIAMEARHRVKKQQKRIDAAEVEFFD